MDQAGSNDYLDDDLLKSLLSDPTAMGFRPSPVAASSGQPFHVHKAEDIAPESAGLDWLGFASSAFQEHIPMLSSNPLAGAMPQAVRDAGEIYRALTALGSLLSARLAQSSPDLRCWVFQAR